MGQVGWEGQKGQKQPRVTNRLWKSQTLPNGQTAQGNSQNGLWRGRPPFLTSFEWMTRKWEKELEITKANCSEPSRKPGCLLLRAWKLCSLLIVSPLWRKSWSTGPWDAAQLNTRYGRLVFIGLWLPWVPFSEVSFLIWKQGDFLTRYQRFLQPFL